MLNKENKLITLPPIQEWQRQQFQLETRAGRDLLADQISKDIDYWCQQQYDDGPRTHLGASIIGHSCQRFIWFSFRWMFREIFGGQMQRLFQRGHLEENRIIEWLQGIGFQIKQVNIDGNQFRIAFADGHGGGSSDGLGWIPTRYGNFPDAILLEFKTQKDKRFSTLVGQGVEKEKPQHFVQASIYGRRLGMHYCLYIAANKETDELNIELVELDWALADQETAKAENIVMTPLPPPRISENPSFWKCKYCPANPICHLNAPILRNCRSCRFAQPDYNKQWRCTIAPADNQIIPTDFIPKGCDQWQPLARM